jgi:helix-turn-helix protein
MSALQTICRKQVLWTDRVLEPSAHGLSPVRETTIYPAQFPILLRERLQGKSVAEVAEYLGVPPEQVNRLLAGHWRPTKGICKRMGLKVVYALVE